MYNRHRDPYRDARSPQAIVTRLAAALAAAREAERHPDPTRPNRLACHLTLADVYLSDLNRALGFDPLRPLD